MSEQLHNDQAEKQRQHFTNQSELGTVAIGGLHVNPETGLPVYLEDSGATLQQTERRTTKSMVDGNGNYLTPSEVADLRQK